MGLGSRIFAAIDLGTTMAKLVLFDEGLRRVKRLAVRLTLRRTGYRAEHDPEEVVSVVRSFLDRAVDLGASAVGVATYRASFVVWRADTGEPLTGIVTWMDRRGLCERRRLPLLARLASRIPGVGQAFSPESPAVKLAVTLAGNRALRRAVASGRAYAWSVDAYIAHRILGRYASSADNAALTGLIDPRSLEPLEPVVRILGLTRLRIPEVIGNDEVVGEWRGVPVGVLAADQQAALWGLGCLERGCWKLTLGTGFFADAPTGGRLLLRAGRGLVPLVAYASSDEVKYALEAYAPGVGLVAQWFVEELAGSDYSILDPYKWDGGVMVAPYAWGLRTPTRIPGSWVAAGVGRVARERLAAALAAALASTAVGLVEALEKALGAPRELVVGGGLSRAARLVEAIAGAIEGVRVKSSPDGDDTARGAALAAARNAGHHASLGVKPRAVEGRPVRLPSLRDLIKLAGLPGFKECHGNVGV